MDTPERREEESGHVDEDGLGHSFLPTSTSRTWTPSDYQSLFRQRMWNRSVAQNAASQPPLTKRKHRKSIPRRISRKIKLTVQLQLDLLRSPPPPFLPHFLRPYVSSHLPFTWSKKQVGGRKDFLSIRYKLEVRGSGRGAERTACELRSPDKEAESIGICPAVSE